MEVPNVVSAFLQFVVQNADMHSSCVARTDTPFRQHVRTTTTTSTTVVSAQGRSCLCVRLFCRYTSGRHVCWKGLFCSETEGESTLESCLATALHHSAPRQEREEAANAAPRGQTDRHQCEARHPAGARASGVWRPGAQTLAMRVLAGRAAELVESSVLRFLTASALEAKRKEEQEEEDQELDKRKTKKKKIRRKLPKTSSSRHRPSCGAVRTRTSGQSSCGSCFCSSGSVSGCR